MRSAVYVILFAVIFSACDDSRLFEVNHDFKDRIWLVNDVQEFEFAITDSAAQYDLYCNLRNSVAFPFSRFFVKYSLKDSIGNELASKLAAAYLFDAKTGKPEGSSGLGDIYDHRIPLLNNYKFNRSGKYRMTLQQYMRRDTLEGILAVGVRVEKEPSQK